MTDTRTIVACMGERRTDGSRPRCRICGGEIVDGDPVRWGTWSTPVHGECWAEEERGRAMMMLHGAAAVLARDRA